MENGSSDESPASAGEAGGSAVRILRGDFATALDRLTVLRFRPRPTAAIGRDALFFPVVGLLIGAVLYGLDVLLGVSVSQELSSVLLVAVLTMLTGGRHLDGFGNTADSLMAFRTRDEALAAMQDRPVGTFGITAIFFVLFVKVRSLDLLADDARVIALLSAPMLGRWAMVALAHGAREAGPAGDARKFGREVGSREFGIASAIAFAVMLSTADAIGLATVIVAAGATVGIRIYLHHRLGGINDQSLGAVAETVETLVFVFFAFTS